MRLSDTDQAVHLLKTEVLSLALRGDASTDELLARAVSDGVPATLLLTAVEQRLYAARPREGGIPSFVFVGIGWIYLMIIPGRYVLPLWAAAILASAGLAALLYGNALAEERRQSEFAKLQNYATELRRVTSASESCRAV